MSDLIRHPNLSRLKGGGDVILGDLDGLHLRFVPPQARLYCHFDRALRTKKFDRSKMLLPGGYDDFASLWNRAEDIPYKFSTLNANDNTVINGAHPDADLIAPLPPSIPTTGPQYTSDQQESIESLKWQAVRTQHLRVERIEQSKAQAKEKREREKREKEEHVIGGDWVDEDNVGASFKKRRVEVSAAVAGPSNKGKEKLIEAVTETQTKEGTEEQPEKEQAGRKEDDADMPDE